MALIIKPSTTCLFRRIRKEKVEQKKLFLNRKKVKYGVELWQIYEAMLLWKNATKNNFKNCV